jgi:hypothetical protein
MRHQHARTWKGVATIIRGDAEEASENEKFTRRHWSFRSLYAQSSVLCDLFRPPEDRLTQSWAPKLDCIDKEQIS